MAGQRDVVIIGGGHNGLVTAFYLARAGRRPLVLERRPVVGGAAITDEFHPGFKISTLSALCGPLRPSIATDMRLERHGLQMIESDTRLFAPAPDGRSVTLYGDARCSAEGIAQLSPRDAEQYVEFQQALGRIVAAVEALLTMTPPDIERPSAGELWTLLKTGRRVRGLDSKDFYRLLRWGPMAVADLMAEFFETDLLRAALAGRGVFGTFLGPWSAGTSLMLLLRAACDGHLAGAVAFPRGGMGALTQAMAAAAREAGAEIRTAAEVERITVKDGVATGVVLAGGEEIPAAAVVSNADPRRTFLRLIDPIHLGTDFLAKMEHYRSSGTVAKINLALSGLPGFTALQGADPRTTLSGRIHIGPAIDDLERAFDDCKYGDFSKQPYLDVLIPSLSDPTLAPAGQHVMSIYVQYVPYRLKSGDWASRREALGETVIKTLAAYAPDLPQRVLHGQILTPQDLEQTYALTGGHIFHGEMSLDQIYTMRPLLGWARYRTPLRRLYLCGAGTHPGGGVTGAPGFNSAREILRDSR
jgi:phytoene dehydrogenase-like protein